MSGEVIVIACNSRPSVGFGHLTRSRAIADTAAERGQRCLLIGPLRDYADDEDGNRFDDWITYPQEVQEHPENRVDFLRDVAGAAGAQHIILDDYTFTGEQQMALRQSSMRLMQQYDASAPPQFAADLAVNASPAEHASLHTGRVMHDDVQFLNGPTYAVLRPQFATAVRGEPGRAVKRILVTFGGGDDRGGISFVIGALANSLPASVRLVIMTAAVNPNLAAIRGQIEELATDQIELAVSPADVAGLMSSCDMAVMAGGTSVFEAAYCGLPMVLTAIAANQYEQCRGWEDLDAAVYLGPVDECSAEDLANCVVDLVGDGPRRERMSRAGMAQVDLHGAARLLDAFLEPV